MAGPVPARPGVRTALSLGPLPPEWLVKCNAMQQGAAVATGDHLLFADADVLHAPTFFATALRAMRDSAPLVAVPPRSAAVLPPGRHRGCLLHRARPLLFGEGGYFLAWAGNLKCDDEPGLVSTF